MQLQEMIFKNEVLRFPRLDTVVMIEDAVQKAKGEKTITEIWKGLPKKVMWQTFITALDYLAYSGKILIDKDKTIVWIWNPRLVERAKNHGIKV